MSSKAKGARIDPQSYELMVSIAADATNQTPHAMGERIEKLASSKTATLMNPRVAVSVFKSVFSPQLLSHCIIGASQTFAGRNESARLI